MCTKCETSKCCPLEAEPAYSSPWVSSVDEFLLAKHRVCKCSASDTASASPWDLSATSQQQLVLANHTDRQQLTKCLCDKLQLLSTECTDTRVLSSLDIATEPRYCWQKYTDAAACQHRSAQTDMVPLITHAAAFNTYNDQSLYKLTTNRSII